MFAYDEGHGRYTGLHGGVDPNAPPIGPEKPAPPRSYHGSVTLDSMRAGADAGKIAAELLVHLAGLPGARVQVTLEIEAEIPQGAPEHIVRIVTENGRSLKFNNCGFEQE